MIRLYLKFNSPRPIRTYVYPFTPVQLYRTMMRWKKIASRPDQLAIGAYSVGQDIDYNSSKEPVCSFSNHCLRTFSILFTYAKIEYVKPNTHRRREFLWYLREKLTKFLNFTRFLREKYFSWFFLWGERAQPPLPPSATSMVHIHPVATVLYATLPVW